MRTMTATRTIAVQTPPTSTSPITSATSVGDMAKGCRRNAKSSWTASARKNATKTATIAQMGGEDQATGSAGTAEAKATTRPRSATETGRRRNEGASCSGTKGSTKVSLSVRGAIRAKVTAP